MIVPSEIRQTHQREKGAAADPDRRRVGAQMPAEIERQHHPIKWDAQWSNSEPDGKPRPYRFHHHGCESREDNGGDRPDWIPGSIAKRPKERHRRTNEHSIEPEDPILDRASIGFEGDRH